jgi:ech hydrogenase subunit A
MSMLLPPFGMLLSKWMAIEATIKSPLILIFIILGSALTVLFWSKWIGRIQTSSYHPKFNKESLDPAMGFSLITLASGVLLTGIGSIWIFNKFFSPITKEVFEKAQVTFPQPAWDVFYAAGNFAAVTLFIAIGIAFVAYWLLVWRRFKETDVRLPYLCGENAESTIYTTSAFHNSEGIRSYAFRSMGDKIENAWSSTTYLKNYVCERKATIWLNIIAWVTIIILLGEAHLL